MQFQLPVEAEATRRLFTRASRLISDSGWQWSCGGGTRKVSMTTTTRVKSVWLALLLLLAASSAGCELVEGIFKVGMWVGIILVVIVLGLIMFVVRKLRR